MIESFINLLTGGLLWISMVGLGFPIVKHWFEPLNSHLERLVLASGLGAGVLSTLVMGAGFLRLLYPWLAWLLVITGLVTGGVVLRKYVQEGWLHQAQSQGVALRIKLMGLISWVLGALAVVTLSSNLVAALAPPSFADALHFYLALPKLYTQAHRAHFVWSRGSGFPAATEMLFTSGLLMRNGIVANLVNYFFGLIAVGGLYLIARRHLHLSKTFSLLGILLYVSLPTVTQMMSAAKPDLALACYAILALYALLTWTDTMQWRWMILSGVFAGLGIGSKTHGLFVFIALGVCLIVAAVMRGELKHLRRWVPQAVLFCCVAILVGSPSYIRNWIWTGNPLWPLMSRTFGGCCISPELVYMLEEKGRWPSGGAIIILKNFILGPWRLMTDVKFFENVESVATPALIAFLPGLLLACDAASSKERRSTRNAVVLLTYCGAFYFIWFFNRARAHYLDPFWPALALLSAFIVTKLLKRSRLVAVATIGTLAISIGFGLGLSALMNAQFFPVVFGFESQEAHLRQKAWYYEDIQYVNKTLPPDARLLSFPNHTYYLDVDYVWGSIHVQTGLIDYFSIHSPEALLARWKELGITHILWDKRWFEGMETWVEHYGMTWELPEQFDQLVRERYLVPIYEHDTQIPTSRTFNTWESSRVVLYEIRY